MMTDKPIIFSAPMIRALLDGRKTQERRVLKPQPVRSFLDCRIPYAPGDRLWVREGHAICEDGTAFYRAEQDGLDYLTPKDWRVSWRSPIHMPRWASRLTLTVTDVLVQRVQEISEADAKAEGARPQATEVLRTYREAFSELWNSIHGPGAWDANPWVAAISFTVERRNIDEVAG